MTSKGIAAVCVYVCGCGCVHVCVRAICAHVHVLTKNWHDYDCLCKLLDAIHKIVVTQSLVNIISKLYKLPCDMCWYYILLHKPKIIYTNTKCLLLIQLLFMHMYIYANLNNIIMVWLAIRIGTCTLRCETVYWPLVVYYNSFICVSK